MVDPIGIKGGPFVDRRLQPVAPAPSVQPAQLSTRTAGKAAPQVQAMAQSAAAQPPVDAERVARIRRAIEQGRFPLMPATIADRLIALKLNWNPNDAA